MSAPAWLFESVWKRLQLCPTQIYPGKYSSWQSWSGAYSVSSGGQCPRAAFQIIRVWRYWGSKTPAGVRRSRIQEWSGSRFERISNDYGKILTWFLLESYTKVAQTGYFFRKNDLRGAIAIKNHPWGKVLLLGVVQWVIKTHSLNDMSLCFREKQREREVFAAFLPGWKGRIEFQSFANPFVVSTFTAQKKPVKWLAEIHLVAGSGIEPLTFRLWAW